MFLLDHVAPEDAQGAVKEAYSVFPQGFPVPEPLKLMSASPELCLQQSRVLNYYINHNRIDSGFFAVLRYVLAHEYEYDFCRDFNAQMLKRAAGADDEELAGLAEHPENAPLEDEQKALLLFVLKMLRAPKDVGGEDVDALRAMGWTDRDIFDAAHHGASFLASSVLWKGLTETT